MKRLAPLLIALVFAGFTLTSTARAQNADRHVTTIEVRDGKVYVNGEVVDELEDGDRPIVFKSDDDTGFMEDAMERFHARAAEGFEFRMRSMPDHDFNVRSSADGLFKRLESTPFDVHILRDGLGGFYSPDVSPEIMKLERESRRLADEIADAEGDTSDLESELDDMLADIFERKLELRRERIEKMETELASMQKALDKRQRDREEIIRQRKDELLGRGDRYEW